MKRVTCSSYLFHFCFIICLTLTACAAKRSATKAVSERETASVTESRLSFYRTIDSLSRQFNLSADSISIIFCNASSPEFPTAFPSEIEGCAETPSPSQANKRMPQADKRPSIASRRRNASRSVLASPSSQVPSSLLIPQSLKIYGLHLNENIEEKSVENADLKDSVNTFTQSEKIKSASKQSSKPSSAPYYIIFIFILIIIIYTVHRLRRFF